MAFMESRTPVSSTIVTGACGATAPSESAMPIVPNTALQRTRECRRWRITWEPPLLRYGASRVPFSAPLRAAILVLIRIAHRDRLTRRTPPLAIRGGQLRVGIGEPDIDHTAAPGTSLYTPGARPAPGVGVQDLDRDPRGHRHQAS